MKLNEFQKQAVQCKVALAAKKRVGQQKMASLPVVGTEKFQRLIDDLGADLIAASIACEALGVTLQYVAEMALQTSEHFCSEDVDLQATTEKKPNDYN